MQNQLNKFGLFCQVQHDDNSYHVTCQNFPQGSENSVSWDDDNYDYEFFIQIPNVSAAISHHSHVMCKLLSPSSIVNLLNKKFYGMDFDVNDLKLD
jgi:hypothetical protein